MPENKRATASDVSAFHPVELTPAVLEAATGTLRMLAEPTRLHLLWLLTHGPRHVSQLVEECGVSRTVVSQHLAKLRLSGLVEGTKDGRQMVYSLRDGHLIRLITETMNHADHMLSGEPFHA